MKKILFICLGNICRSPAADGIMRHLVAERGLDDEFLIDSAGIGSWHVGQLPDRRMRQCGQRHGYNFDHRARQFSSKDFARFDYIAVMDALRPRRPNVLVWAENVRGENKNQRTYPVTYPVEMVRTRRNAYGEKIVWTQSENTVCQLLYMAVGAELLPPLYQTVNKRTQEVRLIIKLDEKGADKIETILRS